MHSTHIASVRAKISITIWVIASVIAMAGWLWLIFWAVGQMI
jgi:hypothetical protein